MSKVIVGCKLPHGLILELGIEKGIKTEAYAAVTLNGSNAKGLVTADGFGLTTVDEAFMTEWLRLHKTHPAVKEGLIYTAPTMDAAQAESHDRRDLRTKLEPMDPNKLSKDATPTKAIAADVAQGSEAA